MAYKVSILLAILASVCAQTTTTTSPVAAQTSYACNPAHQYTDGTTCVLLNGTLTLLALTSTATATPTQYACNPAHSYPGGISCISTNGALTLVSPSASASASSITPVRSASNAWTTTVVTAFTTYCPSATTFSYQGVTYTATSATTITITSCSGGCTIAIPAASKSAASKSAVSSATTTSGTSSATTASATPDRYSGAAPRVGAGSALLLGALGLLAL